jgi:hypothetical protein
MYYGKTTFSLPGEIKTCGRLVETGRSESAPLEA